MHLNRTRFTVLAAFIVALLAFSVSMPHAAWAGSGDDDCSNQPAPPEITKKTGGYNGPNPANSFNNNYQNSAQQIAQKRGLSKFQMLIDAPSIDAKAHYCWSMIDAAFDTISLTSNLKNLLWTIIKSAIAGIINNVLLQACQAALGFIALLPQIVSLFSSKLCLPIPRLQLPHFHLPSFGSAASCNGLSLANMISLGGTQGNKNQTIYWKLWNKTGAQ